MTRPPFRLAALAALAATCPIAAAAPAAAGAFTTISVPGADQTFAFGINNASEIVGGYAQGVNPVFGGPNVYGYTDVGGVFTTIEDPLAVPGESELTGVNNHGALSGIYVDGSGNTYGFLESGGTYATIAPPGLYGAYGVLSVGVNDNGEAVGSFYDAAGNIHGFSYLGGLYTQIDDPNATSGLTFALGVTNAGGIYGYYYDASFNAYGFEDVGGVFTTLEDPQHPGDTVVNGANNTGRTVGNWQDAAGYNHAFIEVGGVYHDLNLPVLGDEAWGVNDLGQVVGIYKTVPGGPYNGFLATVPEPGAWALMLLGFGLVGAGARARRLRPAH